MCNDTGKKTVLVIHSTLFQFKVMPSGLYNALVTFERLMDRVLQSLHLSWCFMYLNDIVLLDDDFAGALSMRRFFLVATPVWPKIEVFFILGTFPWIQFSS